MNKLYLSYSKFRRRCGSEIMTMVTSRFIRELPDKNIEYLSNRGSYIEQKIVKQDFEYKRGQFVEHSLFGKGKIINVEGSCMESKLTVMFHGNIQKKLIAKYANLKIVYN